MTIEFFRVYLVINSKAFATVNMSKLILISVNCMHSPTNYSSFDPFEMKGLENFVSFDDKGPLFNFKFCIQHIYNTYHTAKLFLKAKFFINIT